MSCRFNTFTKLLNLSGWTYPLLILLSVALSGCVTTAPAPYGTFIEGGGQAAIASDTVAQLVALYPPAKTSFALPQPAAEDAFGAALVKGLRAEGYAISIHAPVVPRLRGDEPGRRPETEAEKLSYLLDNAGDNVYISLRIGQQALSRAYLRRGGELLPAGYWAWQE